MTDKEKNDTVTWLDSLGDPKFRDLTSDEIVDLRAKSIMLASATLSDRLKTPKSIFRTAGHIYDYLLTGEVAEGLSGSNGVFNDGKSNPEGGSPVV